MHNYHVLIHLGGQDYIEFESSSKREVNEEDRTDISLITGKLRISNTSNLEYIENDTIG